VQAGETDEMTDETDDMEVGWLLPPQAIRPRRRGDTIKAYASGLFMDHILKFR
jgi:hypothetical protein